MSMRPAAGLLGVLTDIHANRTALAAVIADGQARGVEKWLVLGDVVAMGSHPGEVLDALDELDVVGAVAGNTERYVLTGDRPDPTFDEVRTDPGRLSQLVEVTGTFAWTRGYLAGRGLLRRIARYPPWVRLQLADGTRVLAVHASSAADDGLGIAPERTDDEYRKLFPDPRAEVVLGGHTHSRTDHRVDGVRFVNPGPVSNPTGDGRDARYLVIDHTGRGHSLEFCDVPYDVDRAVADIVASSNPGAGFLLHQYFDR